MQPFQNFKGYTVILKNIQEKYNLKPITILSVIFYSTISHSSKCSPPKGENVRFRRDLTIACTI